MTVPAEQAVPDVASTIEPSVSQPLLPQQMAPQQSVPPQIVVNQAYGVPPQRLGHSGEIRSPGLVLLLTWITFGLYGLYIHFKLNKEMKEFTSSVNVSPGLATFALIIPIASLITVIGTTSRVGQTQASVGLRATTSGLVTFLCMLVGANWAYQQSKLNGVWQHVTAQNAPRSAAQ